MISLLNDQSSHWKHVFFPTKFETNKVLIVIARLIFNIDISSNIIESTKRKKYGDSFCDDFFIHLIFFEEQLISSGAREGLMDQ